MFCDEHTAGHGHGTVGMVVWKPYRNVDCSLLLMPMHCERNLMFSGINVDARAATSIFASHLELISRNMFCDVRMYLKHANISIQPIFVFPQELVEILFACICASQ
jgi:hypothetical protein